MDALIDVLHEAGVSCWQLSVWDKCTGDGGREDHCHECRLGSPEICDAQVIKALAAKLVAAARQADAALDQRDHWRGVASRLADKFMEGESCRSTTQKRHA